MTSSDWIGKYCADGKDFGATVARRAAPHFEDVRYVSRDYGSDGNTGDSWATACKTINVAMDNLLYNTANSARGRHQAIYFQGRLTSGNAFTTLQAIDLPGISLIGGGGRYGMGGGWDSVFVTPGTALAGGGSYGHKAGLALAHDDLEVCGIKFYNPDPTQAQYHILLEDSLSPGDGRNSWIHDNVFQGDSAGTASRTSGIKVLGIETSLIENNMFYYPEYGISISAGAVRYPNKLQVLNNHIFAPSVGIELTDDYCVESIFEGNRVIPKNTYGYTFTYGIDANANSGGNLFCNNIVGHATEGTAYRYGTNMWINNYHATSGGTLANPDA